MLLFEIEKSVLKKYDNNVQRIILDGEYIPRTDDFIRQAFNFGRGTKKDMRRYMHDNACFCVWYDPAARSFVKTIKAVRK